MSFGHPCYVHPDRLATRRLRVPCAPNGVLYVCDDCHKDKNAVFAEYSKRHGARIRMFVEKFNQ